MTAQLAPPIVFKDWDNNGAPLAFGNVWTYIAGTTTQQATYVDSTQTTQNTNPVQLNNRGEANIWLDPTKGYKFVVFDSAGNQIHVVDNIIGPINIGTSLIPSANNTFDIGSASFQWRTGYFGTSVLINGVPAVTNPQTPAELSALVTPTNYVMPTLPFADVRRYGCVCDGVTDDTAALQKAFNVTATTGLALVLPYGYKLKITSYVQIFSNTTFYILGMLQLTARASGLYANGASNIGIYGNKVGQIQDATVFSSYVWNPGTGNTAPAIHIRSCNHVTVDGLNVSYCSQGIFTSNASQNFVPQGTPFNPSQAYPLDVKVRDCSVTFCEWSGIATLSSDDSGYYNNYVYRCGDGGLWMMGTIRGEVVGNKRASPQTVYADVITFGPNNAAHPTTWNDVQGMEFEGCLDLLIANNIVEYIQGEGIDIKQNCNRVLCTGNRVSYCEQSSIIVREGDPGDLGACYKVTISNNTISNHGYSLTTNAVGGSNVGAIAVSSDYDTVIKDNTIFSYRLTPGIYCGGPGTYQSSQFPSNQQQASLTVTGNVVEFMGSNPFDTSEFQFTSATLGAIVIGGVYTSVKCDGNKIRTDRYYYTDARINTSPAITLSYTTPSGGLYYPTSASVSNNEVAGWGFTGIQVSGIAAMSTSGLAVNGNIISGAGGFGINLSSTNYAVCNGNNVSQNNNSVTGTYAGINLLGVVGTPMQGIVCSGNSVLGGWNIGGNGMAYCIQTSFVSDVNLTNNKMAAFTVGALNFITPSGNHVLTGSTGFPRTGGGTPNGAQTSFFIGEMYFDSTNLKWWAASAPQSTVWTQLSN